MTPETILAAAALANHTVSRCGGKTCYRNPDYVPKHRCCDELYCAIAKDFALSEGVTLPQVRDTGLLFMSNKGCTVPPHLRPNCTLHDCQINSLGFDPKDPEWTEKYFSLRESYTRASMELAK